MTAGTHRTVRPWRAEITEVIGSLRLAATALAARLRALLASRPGDPPVAAGAVRAGATPDPWDEEAALRRALHSALFWADPDPAPGAAPGQATDAAAHVSVPADDAAAPLPLPRAVPPSAAGGQGQPTYAVRPDGLVIVGEDGHLTIATPARQAAARRCAETIAMPLDDGDVVPYWYRVWLAAHPEAEPKPEVAA